MSIDPRAIQIFRAVCQEGSISGAARVLNVSQPSVSVAMSRLEDTVGSRLFERHRAGIVLTREGGALERYALALENLLEAASQDVALARMDISGSIKIGGTPGALASLMPQVLNSLTREVPRFQMRMQELPDPELETRLRNRDIDIAVVTVGSRARPEDMEELPLLSDPFSLIAGRENAHLPDPVSLKQLDSARWILPDARGGFNRQVSALFLNANVRLPLNVLRSDSLLATKAIIRATDFVTILPRRVAELELRTGYLRALEIVEAKVERQVGILWLKGQSLNPLAQRFVEHARRVSAA